MANNEKDVNELNKEGAQNQENPTEVMIVKQKGGIGTVIKIGAGLLLTGLGIGVGWLLKGLFGGGHGDESEDAVETDGTVE